MHRLGQKIFPYPARIEINNYDVQNLYSGEKEIMTRMPGFMNVVLMVLLAMVVFGCSKPKEEAKNPTVARPGLPAPDFDLQDTNGKFWKLSDLKGQVVFVNFWATWCPPCREEMPSMSELNKAMPEDRFKMLTILSNDDPTLALNFLGKVGADFPILLDPLSKIANAYGLTGVPETFIVDKKGILRQKYIGPRNWSSREAKQMIMTYIKR